MRILINTLLSVVYAYKLKHFDGTFPCLLFRIILVVAGKSLHKLVSDCIYRIKAGHRILEDHACLVSSEIPHLLFIVGQQVFTVKRNGSAHDFARALEKSHD